MCCCCDLNRDEQLRRVVGLGTSKDASASKPTLMKMLPTPERRLAGSRWDHMMRIGLPFSGA